MVKGSGKAVGAAKAAKAVAPRRAPGAAKKAAAASADAAASVGAARHSTRPRVLDVELPAPSRGTGRWDRSVSSTERREEQRSRVLAAATRVIARQGMAKTSVQLLLNESGVGRRTFYEHFDDLPSVLAALQQEVGLLAFGEIERAARDAPDPFAQLRAVIEAFLRLVSENPDLARVLLIEARLLGTQYDLQREAVVQRFSMLLIEGAGRAHTLGLVSRPPDVITVYALVSAVEAVALRYVQRRESHRAMEALDLLVELILRAFR